MYWGSYCLPSRNLLNGLENGSTLNRAPMSRAAKILINGRTMYQVTNTTFVVSPG